MSIFSVAWRGDLERVRALVEQDAGVVHAVDSDRCTALIAVARHGQVEVARYLLDHGAAVDNPDPFGRTPLHWACSNNHARMALLLLQRGADITALSEDVTPLMSAAMYGSDAVVRVLLEHGGNDLDAMNPHGTACHWACDEGHGGVLRQLLEAGADPLLGDAHDRTALDIANIGGHQECISILQEWHRAHQLQRVRCLRDASSTPPSSAPEQAP